MSEQRERIMKTTSTALLAVIHALASLSGWITVGTASIEGDGPKVCMAIAIGCYGLAMLGHTLTANNNLRLSEPASGEG